VNQIITGSFKKISISLALLIILFVLSFICLFALADMVFEDRNIFFDERVFVLINPHINAVNTSIFKSITFFGSITFLRPANLALALYFLFFTEDKHNAWKVAVVAVTNSLVLFWLKKTLQRPRPIHPVITNVSGYSFPSGHTFCSAVFFGMLIYVAYYHISNNTLKWFTIILMALFAVSVGFSRIYLRVHYASDVIAGLCLGIIWLVLAKWILVKADAAANKLT
jgi:membrane-associated phospholipid phosphatase